MLKNWRGPALLAALLGPWAVFMLIPEITQDPRYHDFADTRTMFGIPNFFNVASNLLFLAVGLAGLALCLRHRAFGARASWIVFFTATALVAFGSGYYHGWPSDSTLLWDRLPMSIAFMALLAALLSEHRDAPAERVILPAAIAAGLFSILWWHSTGDLRIYASVQLAPLLAIVVLLAGFRARHTHRASLAYGLALYVLAKGAESADGAIATLTAGAISGHALKHLLASLAILCIYVMLRVRAPVARIPPSSATR